MTIQTTPRMMKFLLALLLIALALIAFNLLGRGGFVSDHSMVTKLIDDLGGLPKGAAQLLDSNSVAAAEVSPVANWEITDSDFRNYPSLFRNLFDQDPSYSFTIDLRVEYADGTEAFLRWSSGRDGIALGRKLITTGEGPPGSTIVVG